MKRIEVVAAVIINSGEILCVQRGYNKHDYISKKYEFPGGKIELGESRIDTIKREIYEELNCEINPIAELPVVEHEYPDFHLTMHSFICSCKHRNIELSEHIDFKWLKVNELPALDWAAADLPIVKTLMTNTYESLIPTIA